MFGRRDLRPAPAAAAARTGRLAHGTTNLEAASATPTAAGGPAQPLVGRYPTRGALTIAFGPIGQLRNMGQTCYAAAGIQCMAVFPPALLGPQTPQAVRDLLDRLRTRDVAGTRERWANFLCNHLWLKPDLSRMSSRT